MQQQASQINVEYFFRLIYDIFNGTNYSGANVAAWAAALWLWVTWIGYILAIVGFGVVIYCLYEIFELRKREASMYGPIHVAHDKGPLNPRWEHIQSLMSTMNSSDWRQAIIEADIMLGDMLTRQGYHGESIGDQLKQVERADFNTIQDAWDAHLVRNEIAHQGSAFDLSQVLAQRTIAKYENVFAEFDAI